MTIRVSSLIIFFLIILLSLKQIRFIDNLHSLYYFTYFILSIIFFIGAFIFVWERKYNILDQMLFFFICSLTISSLNSDNILLFLSIYILPISGYFIFRFTDKKVDIFKLMLFFSIFMSCLTITEFVTENFLNYHLFNYGGMSEEYLQAGNVYNTLWDWSNSYHSPLIALIAPDHSFVVRPLGVGVAPQLTGALLASFILFAMSIIRSKHYLNDLYPKTIYLSIFIASIALAISSSGTGLLILAVGSLFLYLNKRNFFLVAILAPLFIYIALFSRGYLYDGSGSFIYTYVFFLLGYVYDSILELSLLTLLIGGDTSLTVDIDYLNFIARFGIFGSILFLLLLFFIKQCWSELHKYKRIDVALIPIILSILAANLHYDSVFRYPASFIFFMIVGYVSHKYLQLRIDQINTHRVINISNTRDE